jgi:NAD(P)-dependent dehydrogenase (short-subunit alcohol dehydrogenase family)
MQIVILFCIVLGCARYLQLSPCAYDVYCAQVEALGACALPFKLDVRDDSSVEAMVQATIAKFGRFDQICSRSQAWFFFCQCGVVDWFAFAESII